MTTSETLGYSLYRNNLTNGAEEGTWYGKINSRGKVTEDGLIRDMLRMNSTVTRQEVKAVLDLLFEALKTRVSEGYNVYTRIFRTFLSMQGVFNDAKDEFDPNRHQIRLHVKESADLKNFIKKDLLLEKSVADERAPRIMSLYDFASDSTNDRLTAGNVATISGKNLFFDADDENQGVFFINEENPAGIRGAEFRSITGLNATFMVPQDLTAGSYTVETRCGFGTIIRTARLTDQVTVG
ncbi:MAG: DUF4469 domain-containing protein [Spirochaetales bacterium]|nr:DUF4469 domain-containing protein [Spirochaetales bacterium]